MAPEFPRPMAPLATPPRDRLARMRTGQITLPRSGKAAPEK
jgi:hypothetical protein